MSQVASMPRVIDYWMGGEKHTPADVTEGDRLKGEHPDVPALFQAQRAFQRKAVAQMWEAGIKQFMVFHAGLPTANHVHQQLTEAKVYYTDDNFDVVQPGAGLLAGVRRRVRYQTLDATDPENLEDLEFNPVIKEDQPIGIIVIGAIERLDDTTAGTTLTNLFDWAQPGSQIAISHVTDGGAHLKGFFDGYDAFSPRSAEAVASLMGSWDGSGLGKLGDGAPEWLIGTTAAK